MKSTPVINECIARLAASCASIEALEMKVKGLNLLSQERDLLRVFQWFIANVDVQPRHNLYPFLRAGALAEDAISFVPLADRNHQYFNEILQISSLAHPLSAAISQHLAKIYEKVRLNTYQEMSFVAAVAVSSQHIDLVHLLPKLETLKVGITEEIEAKVLELRLMNLLVLNQQDTESDSLGLDSSIALTL